MIVLRQKEFIGLDDGFGGAKGQVIRVGKKSDAYKKFGPWKIKVEEVAEDDYSLLSLENRNKVDRILEELKTKPFQGNCGQHPLFEWAIKGQPCVVWSAEINEKDRITYLIYKFQNYISVINIGGHKIADQGYAIRDNEDENNKVKKN